MAGSRVAVDDGASPTPEVSQPVNDGPAPGDVTVVHQGINSAVGQRLNIVVPSASAQLSSLLPPSPTYRPRRARS